ncbi:hypothetical protein DFH06DRAFT_1206066 [Mycena polygramma]|nr:hypothetical protein DFH06DRAFT_1206066 [Mycena polygramma]
MHPLRRILLTVRRHLALPRLTSSMSFQDPLPMELWELVFEALTDDALLIAAQVCCAWNERCTRRFLLNKGFPPEKMMTGTVSMKSDVLPVLQISRIPPSIKSLVCKPRCRFVIRDLAYLQSFVSRSHHIENLTLSFHEVLFNEYHHLSRSSVQDGLCRLIQTMAQKTAGPAVLIAYGDIFVVERRVLAKWVPRRNCSSVLRRLPLVDKAQAVLAPESQDPQLSLLVGHSGKEPVFACLAHYSVEMRSMHPPRGKLLPSTFISFDSPTKLRLGHSTNARAGVSVEQLNAILPYIRLSALHTIEISVALDRAAFTQFLAHHPRIWDIEIIAGARMNPFRVDQMLTVGPVPLPNLQYVICTSYADLVPLLNSFHPSPKLSAVVFWHTSTPSDSLAFRRALRRMSMHVAPLYLDLRTVPPCTEEGWPDTEDQQITGVLYCVDRLSLTFTRPEYVRATLSWVACLPRLLSLELRCHRRHYGLEDWATLLLEEVRAALPWVPEIVVS